MAPIITHQREKEAEEEMEEKKKGALIPEDTGEESGSRGLL